MAADIPIVVEQWATFNPYFIYDIDGVPVDLTGCTAKMQVRQTKTSATVLLELSTDNGSIVIDGEAGKIAFDVSNTDTGDLSVPDAFYDLLITYTDGTVERLISGKFSLSFGVTRP